MEVGNKPSYMGVYPSDIIFPPDPPTDLDVVLPKFGVAIWLKCERGDRPTRLIVRVYIPPGRTQVAIAEINTDQIPEPPFDTLDGGQHVVYSVNIPLKFLAVPHEGFIEATVETERGEIRAGRIRVRMPGRPHPETDPSGGVRTISPTASPPPSEQSPDASPASKRRRGRGRPSTHRSGQTPEQE